MPSPSSTCRFPCARFASGPSTRSTRWVNSSEADDIDFESAEFSARFHVSSDDRKWAYDVIHARMMEFMLTAPSGSALEMGSHEIAVFKRGQARPADYEAAIGLIEGFRERIPDYMVVHKREWSSMSAWVFLIPPVLVVTWGVLTYNTMVRLRQMVRQSWSGIDTELKRRYDLNPNLVDVVKGYAAHESGAFARAVSAGPRSRSGIGRDARRAGTRGAGARDHVNRLLAVVEAYARPEKLPARTTCSFSTNWRIPRTASRPPGPS